MTTKVKAGVIDLSEVTDDLAGVLLVNHGVVASTSGTSIDFTGIPSWVKRITISFAGVSVSGAVDQLIQIGDAGGVEDTGYLGAGWQSSPGSVNSTAGFIISSGDAAAVLHGQMVLTLIDPAAFTWVASGVFGWSNASKLSVSGGSKSLSAALTNLRITNVGGAATFDAGKINIQYE